jgi:predicted nucleic acid-binding protein
MGRIGAGTFDGVVVVAMNPPALDQSDPENQGSPGLFLIDTSVWIFALRRGRNEAIARRVDALLEQDTAATCGLVELELLGGAARRSELTRLRSRLRGLHQLSIDSQDWHYGADVSFTLRRHGITVPPTDALLAAVALRHDAVLLHADRDFDLVARHHPLRVESLVELVGAE